MSLGPTLRKLIDSDVARASTLPAQFYKDPALVEEEKRRIFFRTWQIVGHVSQLQNPGDYITTNFLGEPLLIVRNNKGELKGFYNVCKHRAGPPAEGCGSRKVFRCGYHGWTYSLDGALLNAPEFEGVQDFSKEKFGLAPIRIAEWEGLIFVNLDSNAEPLIPIHNAAMFQVFQSHEVGFVLIRSVRRPWTLLRSMSGSVTKLLTR